MSVDGNFLLPAIYTMKMKEMEVTQDFKWMIWYPFHVPWSTQHQQTWPKDLDTQTKLWGTEAELWARAQFVASTYQEFDVVVEAKKKHPGLPGVLRHSVKQWTYHWESCHSWISLSWCHLHNSSPTQ
jgi:hypothetical protein